jgi:hypothetical protein
MKHVSHPSSLGRYAIFRDTQHAWLKRFALRTSQNIS